MSKTGGGRGTNQYEVKGTSLRRATEDHQPEATLVADPWEARLAQYRYFLDSDAKQAVPEPAWDDVSDDYQHLQPTTAEHAIARYRARLGEAIHGDAILEGITYTLPEIEKLMAGMHVPGHYESEEMQAVDLKKASDYLTLVATDGPRNPSQSLSDDLHQFISSSLPMPTPQFRGDQTARYDGPRVRLGQGKMFQAVDARLAYDVLDAGLARIAEIRHPVVRGATWAAFAAYQQFYFDGNKRTGRYTMNTVNLSHGYDAIVIPPTRKNDYEDTIVEALKSDDLTNHIRLIMNLYPSR